MLILDMQRSYSFLNGAVMLLLEIMFASQGECVLLI
jgi:hypothetical protein